MLESKQKNQIDISIWNIVKIFLTILFFLILYKIIGIILLLFLAFILSAALEPIILWFQKRNLSRTFIVLLLYFILSVLIITIVSLISVPLVKQFAEFGKKIPELADEVVNKSAYLKDWAERYNIDFNEFDWSFLTKEIGGVTKNLFSVANSIYTVIISLLSLFIISIYLSLEGDKVKNFILYISPDKYDDRVANGFEQIRLKLGRWILGQIILGFAVGTLTYLSMLAIGLGEYALVIACIAGFLELIPMIGPIITVFIVTLVGFLFEGWIIGIIAFVIAFIIQQVENYLLQPKIMSQAVSLNPIVIMVSLLVGGELLGLMGMILAVPLAATASVIYQEIQQYRKFDALKK